MLGIDARASLQRLKPINLNSGREGMLLQSILLFIVHIFVVVTIFISND